MPTGVAGMMGGAAIVFFAFIGFDAVSTTAEETSNPQRDMADWHHRKPCHLHRTLRAHVRSSDCIKKYTNLSGRFRRRRAAFAGRPWAQALVSAGALAGMTSVLARLSTRQPRIFMAMARDGLLHNISREFTPAFARRTSQTIWTAHRGRWRGHVDRHRIARLI